MDGSLRLVSKPAPPPALGRGGMRVLFFLQHFGGSTIVRFGAGNRGAAFL